MDDQSRGPKASMLYHEVPGKAQGQGIPFPSPCQLEHKSLQTCPFLAGFFPKWPLLLL